MLATRACPRCNRPRPLNEFSKRKTKPGSYYSWCKACRATYGAARYEEQLERQKAYSRKYYRKKQLAKHGLTPNDYDEMLKAQDGSCAICGKTPEENGKRLAIDHNHRTEEVRQLLCSRCNLVVGWLETDFETYEQARRYLQRHGR